MADWFNNLLNLLLVHPDRESKYAVSNSLMSIEII
jgi:hypothetical protein